jgi:UDP-N-acetylmuramyl pentapeptide phosphotransferase/UDP-N-acetylglucosamine-1-phosphate transferase
MLIFIYLISLVILIGLLNQYCLKNNYLLSETGDAHQKFASNSKIPLTGGVFIYLGFLFLFNYLSLLLFIFSILIFFLGLISDLKLIKSANRRLLIQTSIVLIFVLLSNLQITETKIYFFNNLLSIEYVNHLFVIFCVLILINGSNFFDGLNTLNIGYFLFISLIINYLILNNIIFVNENDMYKNLTFILLFTYFLNFKNKIFLGDSGSYLLGFFFSVLLINLYDVNNHISPYYIVLLVWYPCYENLFSIVRKKIFNRSSMKPDSNHLHQLIFFFIKKKFLIKTIYANLLSANLINIFNFIVFLISSNFISKTKIVIFFIIFNLIVYTFTYYVLFNYRYKKL